MRPAILDLTYKNVIKTCTCMCNPSSRSVFRLRSSDIPAIVSTYYLFPRKAAYAPLAKVVTATLM